MLKAGVRGKRGLSQRSRVLRERASLSFFLVVMFFAVFGVIVLTEVLLIDERGLLPAEDYSFLENGQVAHILAGPGDVPPAAESLPAGLGGGAPVAGAGAWAGAAGALGAAAAAAEAERLQGFEAHLPPPAANLSARDGTWQIVPGTRHKFFVFSAFYDARDERVVRVIGATKTRFRKRAWCRLWYAPANATNATSLPSVSVPAKVKSEFSIVRGGVGPIHLELPRLYCICRLSLVIRENWNLKYSACFVLCPLGRNLSAPASVSVVSRLRLPPANRLLVRNTAADPELRNASAQGQQQPPPPPEGLAVCVKPLHFSYNQALHAAGGVPGAELGAGRAPLHAVQPHAGPRRGLRAARLRGARHRHAAALAAQHGLPEGDPHRGAVRRAQRLPLPQHVPLLARRPHRPRRVHHPATQRHHPPASQVAGDAPEHARHGLLLLPERLLQPAVAGRRGGGRRLVAADAAQDAPARQAAPAQAALQVRLPARAGGGGGQPLRVGAGAGTRHAQRARRRRHPAPLPRLRVRRRRLRQGAVGGGPHGAPLPRAAGGARSSPLAGPARPLPPAAAAGLVGGLRHQLAAPCS